MITSPDNRRGFTLVEAIIVLVVIAALLSFFIPYTRERERQRLQALADSEPLEAFEFSATPSKDSVSPGESLVVRCRITNRTDFPLTLPKSRRDLEISFEGARYTITLENPSDLIPSTPIGPQESVRFDIRFMPWGEAQPPLQCSVNGVSLLTQWKTNDNLFQRLDQQSLWGVEIDNLKGEVDSLLISNMEIKSARAGWVFFSERLLFKSDEFDVYFEGDEISRAASWSSQVYLIEHGSGVY
jgi:prepilin-type N-terminal cleavage/methylation domain-containing protein